MPLAVGLLTIGVELDGALLSPLSFVFVPIGAWITFLSYGESPQQPTQRLEGTWPEAVVAFNFFIERTFISRLRPLMIAAHVGRWAV